MSKLDAVKLPYFTHGVLGSVLWATSVTRMNIVVVGYDTASVTSHSFNSTNLLWYEDFALTALCCPKSWTCIPSQIMPGQSCSWNNIVANNQASLRQTTFSSTNLLGLTRNLGMKYPTAPSEECNILVHHSATAVWKTFPLPKTKMDPLGMYLTLQFQ
jgi:hypothetical protein